MLSNEFFPLRIHQNRIDVGWGYAPDPTGGAYSAPPDPIAGFKGATSPQEGNGREGKEGLGRGKTGREGNGGMGKGGKRGKLVE